MMTEAVLKRYTELLISQRDRFQNYLIVLERQKDSIASANVEGLLALVDLEEQTVAEIFSIQKVINPLEKTYNAAVRADSPSDEISALKAALDDLKRQAVALSSCNRDLLADRMTEIRGEINVLKNNPLAAETRRSVYRNYATASLIDIKG
jgi:predicted  nucleic acid-binding Zn-ribbon protein